MADNLAAALCYVLGLLTGILFLVLEPYNKNKLIRFHAFQSIFLNLALVVVDIGLTIVFSILFRIPGLGFRNNHLAGVRLGDAWVVAVHDVQGLQQ